MRFNALANFKGRYLSGVDTYEQKNLTLLLPREGDLNYYMMIKKD